MASTFSNLKIQLMATGENAGTWGNTTNANLGTAIEQALVETATVTFASGNVTLTLTDSNSAQNARALRLNLAGTTAGARDLIVPAIQKPYIVNNGTADIITVKNAAGTGIAVPAGRSFLVYNNGTNVVNALDGISVGSGGTGLNTLTNNNVIIGNAAAAVKFVAPGTSGNVLTSNGTTWVSSAGGGVTSVSGTGTVQGLTLTGTVTTSGSLTLGGSLSAVNLASQVTGTLPTANGGTGNTSGTVDTLSTASGAAPSFSARAWVNFNGTGSPAIRASGNVSSITDNGTGNYTVNFTTAMPDTNYCVVATTTNNDNSTATNRSIGVHSTTTSGGENFTLVGSVRTLIQSSSSAEVDSSLVCVAIFR